MTKVQPPTAPGGRFAKDRFTIDLAAGTVTCPGQVSVADPTGQDRRRGGRVRHRLRRLPAGRPVHHLARRPHRHHRRPRGATGPRPQPPRPTPRGGPTTPPPGPKVERKIGHLMRRRHGGRRARVRGTTKVAADFSLLAAAVNLARLGVLGLRQAAGQGWQVAPA